MKNEKEKCLFPTVSHFVFESFIYVTRLSAQIKGTANYTYQPFFRLWRSTAFLLASCGWVGVPVVGDLCPDNQTLPLFCQSLEQLGAQSKTLLILNQ